MSQTKAIDNGFLIYKRLLHSVRQYFWIFAFGIVGTLAVSFSDAAFTWLIKPIVDKGFVQRDAAFIHWLPIVIIAVFLFRGAAGFVSSYFVSRVARSVVMNFRRAIFRHLLILPSRYYDRHSSGQVLATIIYNVDQVAQASSQALITILREGTLLIGLLGVMFFVSWRLTLLFLVVTPFAVMIVKVAGKRMRGLSSNVQHSVGDVTHVSSEAIDAYKVIRLYNGQEYENQKFHRATKLNFQREMKMVVTNSLMSMGVQLFAAIAIGLVLFFSISLHWGVSAGGFASIVAAMIGLLRPLRRITSVNGMIQKGIAGAASVFRLVDQHPETDQGVNQIERAQGEIEFSNVSFRYQNDGEPVLRNISFKINPGETVAIVGKSGAGKSSLINLLPRFYEIERGTITLDGKDIRDYKLQDLRNQFSLVQQNPSLFNDTIRHNIAYAAKDIDEVQLRAAAQSAHALEFIEELPEQFDTLVGEDGVLLSGGQRQRIAIARALFKSAPILILDEATSALDTRSERYIQEALNELMQHCTTLVIAHRLSTIEKADRILVIDKGVIVESGTHEALLQQNGVYTELHQMQFARQEAGCRVD